MHATHEPRRDERRFPRDFVSHLRAMAGERPADTALIAVSRDGETRFDYRALDLRVRALAAALQARFITGDRALLLLDNDEHHVIAFLACLHAGLIAVPVFPPESTREQHLARLAGIASDCTAAAVLTTASIREMLGAHARIFGAASVVAVDEVDGGQADAWRPHEPRESGIAFLQYTSGSTSAPKGVMVSHANLMANERAIEERLSVGPDDVFVNWLPLYHDMGLIGGLLQPLHRGIPVVLMSPSMFLERPARWLEAISRHRGTISGGPDFAFRLCLDRVKDARLDALDLSSWRVAFSGAEPVRHDTLHAFIERFRPAGFDAAAVYPCYGLAEATLLVTGGVRGNGLVARGFSADSLAQGRPVPDAQGTTLVGCGIVASGHRVEIVDTASLTPVALGHVGEIWAAGSSIARGYWQRREDSERSFVERDGARWLRTGDLGFMHGGQLFVTGRIKDLIILRGHNVYPQDIERCIEAEVDAVRSGRVAAFAVETARGEGIGVAAEVSRSMQRLAGPQALVDALADAVSALCGEAPSVVVLLQPGGLPKTSSGKLQRGACRQGWVDGTLPAYAIHQEGRFVLGGGDPAQEAGRAASDEIEAALARMWQDLLPWDAASPIAPDRHFFASGGHSLAAVQLSAAISQCWKVAFPVRLVFENPRLVDCAAALRRQIAEGARGEHTGIPVLLPGQRGQALPVSHAQERQWFLWQLDLQSSAYHIGFALRLSGAMRVDAWHAALDAAVQRHESLRTVFAAGPDGRPRQRVLAPSPVAMPLLDLREVPVSERESRAAEEARALQFAPMDLTAGPLLRTAMLRLGEDVHVFVMVIHHIVSDGASIQCLLNEIANDYVTRLNGGESTLTAPPVQYVDYALWQREWLAGGEAARQLAWWREQLGSHHPVLELAVDQARGASAGGAAARHALDLPPGLVTRLRESAHAQDATLFMALLAGLQALLHRYTGQEDIRIGVPMANRGRPEVQGVVGLFVNTLVVRGALNGRSTFAMLLAQARAALLGAQSHQELPFEQLVEALQPVRTPGHSPLVQVVINHLAEDFRALDALPGLSVEEYPLAEPPAQFELALDIVERSNGSVQARFHFARALFEPARIERMAGHYLALLEAIADRPAQAVGDVAWLSDREAAVLQRWSVADLRDTDPQADSQPVHRLIERRARTSPDAPALILGDEVMSHAQLNAAANRLAHRLASLGLGAEHRVGIALERTMQMAVSVLAVMKAGAAYVPLDPAYPAQRLALMAEDSALSLLLTQAEVRAHLPQLPGVTVMALDDVDLSSEPDSDVPAEVHDEQLAYVIYTSGSTGRPKGVGVSHAALSAHLQAAQRYLRLGSEDRMLQFSTMSFDAFVEQLLAPLVAGAAVVLRGAELWDSARFHAELIARRITVADLPAAYWNVLAQDFARRGRVDAGALRQVHVSGEAMPPQGVQAWRDAGLASVNLLNLYGPTEAVVTSTVHDCTEALSAATTLPAQMPIGTPLEGRQLHVLDAEMNLVPAGVPGELCIGGALLARGYLDRPALTAERFVANPFDAHGGRMYRTGDLVRWNAKGQLEFLGRVDQQVKVRGLRVELGEIEVQLLAQPEVREAAVVARDEAGGPRLVGYVSLHEAGLTDGAVLRQRLVSALPDYMVPSVVVVLDRLPLGVHGKLDRAALPAPVQPERPLREAPQGELEAQLARIWSDVLPMKAVGRHDSFFELGGHSLLLLQVHRRIEDDLGRRTAVVELFKYPTVASLAAFLASPAKAQAAAHTTTVEDRALRQPAPSWRAGLSLKERDMSERTGVEIAIVGMAGRFPGAADVEAFWRNIREGVESISRFSDAELLARGVAAKALADPHYVKAGAALDGMDRFDAGFFGYSPREAQQFDPQHRLFLETAWEALEHAGHGDTASNPLTAIYAGCGANLYLMKHLLPSLDWRGSDIATLLGLMNGNDQDSLVSRVAYKLDLRGPAVAVQTACSTSLAAVHLACRGLLNHEADMALAGGVWLNLLQQGGYRHQPGAILSPDGHCRAFDARAAGTVIGSGVGVVVLKRLDDALASGDTIHAVIKGSALNNDGAGKVGFAAPSVDGQAEVIVAAQAMAGVPAQAIGYVEAHGTGTTLGDPIEVAALAQAFRMHGRQRQCAIGSVKTNVGHLDAAAGVAGLIKAAMAVRYGVLPPSLHFETPNPQIDFDSGPFYVNTDAKPWPAGASPRCAGVSSFGMGGTNVHVVLEEAPAALPASERAEQGAGQQLLLLSARSAGALDAVAARLAGHLAQAPELSLADAAHTLRVGRRRFPQRAAVLASSRAEAVRALEAQARDAYFTGQALSDQASVAFMFPGQGAQHADMGRALYDSEPVFRSVVDECCEQLRPELGVDLRALMFARAAEQAEAAQRLQQTAITQPALFVVEYAMARLWMSWGIQPGAMLGHSIGEYVAACVAGVFTLEDALRLVAARGRLLQGTPPGAMLAVSLPEHDIATLGLQGCDLAAVNAADLCVVSGTAAAVERAQALLEARGVAVSRLHVSHAFHSALVEPMLGEFERLLARTPLAAPRIPFISNVSGQWITADEARSPSYWVRHLRGTVRFADGVRELLAKPDRVLLEVGPGETLSGLARRQAAGPPVLASQCHPQRLALNAQQMARCVAQLWTCGIDAADCPLLKTAGRRVPLPTYPFERASYWVDAPGAATAPAPAPDRLGMADWFHVPVWKQAEPPMARTARTGGVVLVLGGTDSLSAALCEALRSNGRTVVLVEADAADLEQLLRNVRSAHGPVEQLIHLWTLDTEASPWSPEALLERGFHSLVALAGSGLSDGEREVRITVVTNALEDVTGSEALRAGKALLHGPCKVIPQEHPQLACRLVDIVVPPPHSDAEAMVVRQLAAELHAGGADAVVAFRGPRRWVRTHEPVARELASQPGLRRHGVYLVTGGLGGLGLSMARHLASRWQARLVLVGRRAPDDRQQQAIEDMHAAGAEVLCLQADVAVPAQVQAAIAQAHGRFGAIHGVIHAAGLPGGGVMAQRSRAAMADVMAPKVSGTLNLMQALGRDTPDFVLLCSSLTAVTGGFGQADYCAANSFLDAVAAQASRAGRRVLSVNWDAWRDVGMAASQALPDGHGIAPEQAGELLERLLSGLHASPHSSPQVLVSTMPLERQFALMASPLQHAMAHEPVVRAGPQHARPALPTPYAEPVSELEGDLAALWSGFLGISPIGIDDSFFELGGDSLLAIQLLAKLRSSYGVELHPGAFFKTPTVAALAVLVETRLIDEIENAV